MSVGRPGRRVTPNTLLTNQKREWRAGSVDRDRSDVKVRTAIPRVLVHAERTCARGVGKDLLSARRYSERQFVTVRPADSPVESELEVDETTSHLGRTLDLPFRVFACVIAKISIKRYECTRSADLAEVC